MKSPYTIRLLYALFITYLVQPSIDYNVAVPQAVVVIFHHQPNLWTSQHRESTILYLEDFVTHTQPQFQKASVYT